jgi:hypothetical protein
VIVDQILDIAECRFSSSMIDERGDLGHEALPSLVIDGHVTDVLNLPALVAAALA